MQSFSPITFDIDQDMDCQVAAVNNHRRQLHEQWVMDHQQRLKWDHHSSSVRAQILVNEAWRLEKIHLQHQHDYCTKLLKTKKRPGKDEQLCACLKAPVHRRLLPKYRAMNLLQGRVDDNKLETAVDNMRQSYGNDHDMIHDLLQRYGDEPEAQPRLWLRSIEERMKTCDSRWTAVGNDVKDEMRDGDNFPTVIRNLSIMRIYLEGSQAPVYSCDPTERGRRDAFHQGVLDRLAQKGKLFL